MKKPDEFTAKLATGKSFTFKRAEEYAGFVGALRKNRELFTSVMRGDKPTEEEGYAIIGVIGDILSYDEEALEAYDTLHYSDLPKFVTFFIAGGDGDAPSPKDRLPKK